MQQPCPMRMIGQCVKDPPEDNARVKTESKNTEKVKADVKKLMLLLTFWHIPSGISSANQISLICMGSLAGIFCARGCS